jgi:hypothetical protein
MSLEKREYVTSCENMDLRFDGLSDDLLLPDVLKMSQRQIANGE